MGEMDNEKINVFQFIKPMTDSGYYFSVGSREAFLKGLHNFVEQVEKGNILMQGIELKEVCKLEDFVITSLTFKFAEKVPLPVKVD